MPALKNYNIFISHTWQYNIDYYNLESLLLKAPYFNWRNFSVPIHDPVIKRDTYVGKVILTKMLEQQIRPTNCVLILAGMYAHYSDWVLKEIELAQSYKKPVLGIYPLGSINIPKVVRENVIDMIGWRTSSIVSAIRKYSI
jgi:hypothetical protein